MNCSEEPSEFIIILLYKHTTNSFPPKERERERERERVVDRMKQSMTVVEGI